MKVMNKGLFTAIILMFFMLAVVKIDASAANVVETKTEGDITWTMYDDGLLDISGSGQIPNNLGYHKFASAIKKINISSSIDSIGSFGVFKNCSALTSITIPSSVYSIGDSAFYGCSALTSITIPSSVTVISDYTFYGCKSLTSITLPPSVTSIDKYAFSHCESLTNITIPSSVTLIGDYAFSFCYSLASITIPSSVTSIGDSAFFICGSLTNIVIPTSVTSIGRYAFGSCDSLMNITIPSSVNVIGDYAFNCCKNLLTMDISEQQIDSTDIDKTFDGTPWLLNRKGTITGAIGDLLYILDSTGNITLSGSGSCVFYNTMDIAKYSHLVRTITISSGTTISYDSNNSNDDIWGAFFTNAKKIINNSSTIIYLYQGMDYSWCNINDTTEPIFSISKGTAVRVTPKLPKHYTIAFDGNDATDGTISNIRAVVNTSQNLPKNIFTKKGYRFVAWKYSLGDSSAYVTDECNIYIYEDDLRKHQTEIITLIAQWEKDPDYGIYSIDFYGNSETNGWMESIYAEADKSAKLPPNSFTKEGYKFKNWKYQIGNKSYTIDDGSSLLISSNDWDTNKITYITLVAQWTKIATPTKNVTDAPQTQNTDSIKNVKGVTLNKKSASIVKGKTLTLKATVKPTNATNKAVTWKSSNKKIATVDKNGKVKGIKAGTAKITIITADGKKTATCKITVKNPVKVKGIKFNKKTYSVKKGKTVTLKTTFSPKDATNKEVTYKSSNKKIATIDKNGKVKGKKKGKVTITVTTKDGKKTAKCTVNVK